MADRIDANRSVGHLGGGECDIKGAQRPSSRTNKNQLNFGWFSMPASNENKNRPVSRGRGAQGKFSSNQGMETNNNMESIAEEYLDEQGYPCSMPPGQEEGFPPPSRSGRQQDPTQQADIQQITQNEPIMGQQYEDFAGNEGGIANNGCPGESIYPYQGQDQSVLRNQSHETPPRTPANFVVDWPLSRTAQEMMMAVKPPQTPTERLPSSSQTRAIPPTPMPPLTWQGSSNDARPTYSTWRQWYHKNVGQ